MLSACNSGAGSENAKSLQDEKPVGSLEVKYAKGFSVDYYEEGYTHIHVMDGSDYIIVPEGKEKRDFDLHNAIYIDKELDNI